MLPSAQVRSLLAPGYPGLDAWDEVKAHPTMLTLFRLPSIPLLTMTVPSPLLAISPLSLLKVLSMTRSEFV